MYRWYVPNGQSTASALNSVSEYILSCLSRLQCLSTGQPRMPWVRINGVLLHFPANSAYERSSKCWIRFAWGIPEAYLSRRMLVQTKGRCNTSEKTPPQSILSLLSRESPRTVDLQVPCQVGHWRD